MDKPTFRHLKIMLKSRCSFKMRHVLGLSALRCRAVARNDCSNWEEGWQEVDITFVQTGKSRRAYSMNRQRINLSQDGF